MMAGYGEYPDGYEGYAADEYYNGDGSIANNTDVWIDTNIVAIPEGENGPNPEAEGEGEPPYPGGFLPEGEIYPGGEPPYPEGETPYPEGETPYPEGETPYPEGETSYPEGAPEGEGEPWGEPEGYAEPSIPLDSDPHGKAAFSSLAGMIAGGIIILNIVALIAVMRKPKQRKSLTYLIGLMAAFDLLGGLQFAWFSSLDQHLQLTRQDYWIIVMCGIWMISMTPQITGLLHFGLHWINALDVGVANARVNPARIAFIVVTAIFLPFIFLIPPLAGWHCVYCTDVEFCAQKCSNAIHPFPRIYVIILIALLLAAMAVVISIYIALGIAMKKKRERQGYLDEKLGDVKLYRTVCMLLAVYIICTLPVSVVLIADYMVINTEENKQTVGRIITSFQATMFVSFLSNFINPIIYFTRMGAMRSALAEDSRNNKEEHRMSKNGNGNSVYHNDKAEEASRM